MKQTKQSTPSEGKKKGCGKCSVCGGGHRKIFSDYNECKEGRLCPNCNPQPSPIKSHDEDCLDHNTDKELPECICDTSNSMTAEEKESDLYQYCYDERHSEGEKAVEELYHYLKHITSENSIPLSKHNEEVEEIKNSNRICRTALEEAKEVMRSQEAKRLSLLAKYEQGCREQISEKSEYLCGEKSFNGIVKSRLCPSCSSAIKALNELGGK